MTTKTCVECKHFYYFQDIPACGHFGEIINPDDKSCKRFIQRTNEIKGTDIKKIIKEIAEGGNENV